MPTKYIFTGEIRRVPRLSGAFVEIPPEITSHFINTEKIKARITFDGKITENTIISKLMFPDFVIGVTANVRRMIDKSWGDCVEIEFCER